MNLNKKCSMKKCLSSIMKKYDDFFPNLIRLALLVSSLKYFLIVLILHYHIDTKKYELVNEKNTTMTHIKEL